MRLSHMENLPLTGAQKSKLRGLGQKLDATLKVGKDGLTPTFITELSRALRGHALIKLRSVGATALFYKPASDPSKSSLPVT